jgi:RNA polymerase sigma factor (TIGR02999 family)
MDARSEITAILVACRSGGDDLFDRLLPLVYDQLRSVAHAQLSRERPGHTLNTTALVHEAYLKLVDQTRADFHDRTHFLAVAARAMRQVLVDHARRHRASKRGGGQRHVDLDAAEVAVEERAEELLALDEALKRLADLSPRLGQVVELRFFGGLTEEEAAAVMGVTARTLRRDWVKARGWLHQELERSQVAG